MNNEKHVHHHDERNKPIFQRKHIGQAIFAFFLAMGIIGYFISGGLKGQASRNLNDIYKQVSAGAVEQYNIANRQGDRIQICVQAGIVAAAYLQEKNESEYRTWKAIQKSDCTKAGMPQY